MEHNILQNLVDFSGEIEEQLIGCIAQGGNLDDAIGVVTKNSFAGHETRIVWEAMIELYYQKKKPTRKNLRKLLAGHEAFEENGTLEYYTAGNCESGVPAFTKQTALNLADIHSRISVCRMAMGILEDIPRSNLEAPTEKLVYEAIEKLDGLKSETSLEHKGNTDVVSAMVHDIVEPPKITPTGLSGYDKLLGGGFMAGEAYTMAAANKAGKTMFAGTISYNLNQAGHKHAYLCLEMGSKQIMQRQFAIHTNVPVKTFWDPRTRTSQQLADQLIKFEGDCIGKDYQIFVDCPILRLSEAKALLYRMKMEGCEGVIIDYFSLIGPDLGFKGTGNEHQDIMAQELTKTAKDIGIWLFIIAQLNNDGSTYGSAALLRSSTHVAALEKCDGENEADNGARYLRTISSRFTVAADIGSETNPGVQIHPNGSHIEELIDAAHIGNYP